MNRIKGLVIGILSLLSASIFAGSPEVAVLEQISTTVTQVSTQLTQMAQTSQQNWSNYFKMEVNAKFSAESFPEWQAMQGDFSTIQSNFNATALDSLVTQAMQHIYNPTLSSYLSEVDQVSLNAAESALNQLNKGDQGPQAITDAVALPLGNAWQQDLATANDLQMLQAISVQMSTNNALLYNLWQQNQTQQVLLSRLLIEMTQLNQNIRQLNSAILTVKSK